MRPVVTERDLFELVVVSGDPNVADGTIGRLMNVFPGFVVIETLPSEAEPEGGQEIVEMSAVARVEGNAAA